MDSHSASVAFEKRGAAIGAVCHPHTKALDGMWAFASRFACRIRVTGPRHLPQALEHPAPWRCARRRPSSQAAGPCRRTPRTCRWAAWRTPSARTPRTAAAPAASCRGPAPAAAPVARTQCPGQLADLETAGVCLQAAPCVCLLVGKQLMAKVCNFTRAVCNGWTLPFVFGCCRQEDVRQEQLHQPTRCKTLTVTPAPWHCSHWYRLPDFVPAPAHVLHLMFRDSDSFLQAPCGSC
jgi:hypothetical protein